MGPISQKMLTKTLRQLERDGLVEREVFPEVPPRVEYRLTRLGRGLGKSVCGIWTWAARGFVDVERARKSSLHSRDHARRTAGFCSSARRRSLAPAGRKREPSFGQPTYARLGPAGGSGGPWIPVSRTATSGRSTTTGSGWLTRTRFWMGSKTSCLP